MARVATASRRPPPREVLQTVGTVLLSLDPSARWFTPLSFSLSLFLSPSLSLSPDVAYALAQILFRRRSDVLSSSLSLF